MYVLLLVKLSQYITSSHSKSDKKKLCRTQRDFNKYRSMQYPLTSQWAVQQDNDKTVGGGVDNNLIYQYLSIINDI